MSVIAKSFIVGLNLIKSIPNWIQLRITKQQFIILSSILVGLSVGMASILLKIFAHYLFVVATTIHFGTTDITFLLPIFGIIFTLIVIKYVLNGKLEKGLYYLHYALQNKSGRVPRSQMYSQILTSSLTVGFGGSAGLEAPIVMTGAAFGSNYAITHKLTLNDRVLLLACGVAAGIGSAFNAPVAGVLFSLEVLQINIAISAFTPLIIAAASGALLSNIILNDNILLSFNLQQPFNYFNVPFYILLGIMAGFSSIYYSRVFYRMEGFFNKYSTNMLKRILIGGTLLAGFIFLFPSLFGEGYQSIKVLSTQNPEKILDNSLFEPLISNPWMVIFYTGLLVLLKVIATSITIGCGGNGGNFAPAMFMGSYLGFFISKLCNLLHFGNLPTSNFVIVGMAGIISGIYHAPLTAIFLIAEITGGYTLIIPLMLVSSISLIISRYFDPSSLDRKKLEKFDGS